MRAARENSKFKNWSNKLIVAAVTWLKYCRYGVKLCPINWITKAAADAAAFLIQTSKVIPLENTKTRASLLKYTSVYQYFYCFDCSFLFLNIIIIRAHFYGGIFWTHNLFCFFCGKIYAVGTTLYLISYHAVRITYYVIWTTYYLVRTTYGKTVPIMLSIDSFVKFTDFQKFSLLYYTWSKVETTLIWKFNPSTIQKSHEKGRFAGQL